MNDVMYFCSKYKACGHENDSGKDQRHYDNFDEICNGTMVAYVPQSTLTALQAKLEKAVKTLTQIRDDLIPGDLYEGSTPYTEMFWAAQKLAKETLKELEAK